MKRSIATLAAGVVALALPVLAQDFSKVEIKTTKLSNAVSMMEGAGGNLAVSVGEDSVFLVDDQYAPVTPKIEAAIKALSDKPVRFVFNTHWHGDHTGGNENLGKAGALIVAHDNVRKRMSAEQFLEAFDMRTPASPKVALPVVTFTQSMSFHLNGEEIRVVHVPRAHTDGDSIVHFVGGDIVHMGDTFFNGMYPFIDGATGGTVEGVLAAVDQVIAMTTGKTKIIPGHGPLASRGDLQDYREMLATVNARVKKAVAEGKTNDEIAKSGLTKDLDEKWGKGFLKPEMFVGLVAGIVRKGS